MTPRPAWIALALLLPALAAPGAANVHDSGVFVVEGGHPGKPQLYCAWAIDQPMMADERVCVVNATTSAVSRLRARIVGDAAVDAKIDEWVWVKGNLTRLQLGRLQCEAAPAQGPRTCDAPLPPDAAHPTYHSGAFYLRVEVARATPPAVIEVEASRPHDSLPLP